MSPADSAYDLLIIGGGINGVGIARDAAGRGLKVLLVERDDLAQATSSASSKLIHGGLRYLEYGEFRLVAEALAEREVLLKAASHLVTPLAFVMPHVPGLRPRWMIRAGLFLYDHLGRRTRLPPARAVDLSGAYGAGLKPTLTKGFVYSDCRVDDARLVISNAMSARDLGAHILTRTEFVSAERVNQDWRARLRGHKEDSEWVVAARAIVNAAGPWVEHVLVERLRVPARAKVKLVGGSHIVLPRVYEGEHAFILQNDDRRMVFMIPFESDYTLIGTTDVPISNPAAGTHASAVEIEYLCRAVNRYLERALTPDQVIWSYAGVRPLYDDGTGNPSAVTRDYTLELERAAGGAPALSIFGGKITTYRKLAEHALDKLTPSLPMKGPWTAQARLPGADIESPQALENKLERTYAKLPRALLRDLARRHGSLAERVLDGVKTPEDLGECFGGNLYRREVDYLIEVEWARSADDILFRRTKAGLRASDQNREALERYISSALMP